MASERFGKVIICIDELDKVLDPQQAREFLRKIKGVFSVPNAYYIVSVSEEALEAFRLRNVLGKDEVDSTFTTVIRLNPLTIAESKLFLRKRNIECKSLENVLAVLSGGIPRDLVRLARKLHLSKDPALLKPEGVIVDVIKEAVRETANNVRHNAGIDHDAKLIVGEIENWLEATNPFRLGTALQSRVTTHYSSETKKHDIWLSDMLLRLGIQLEILGYLGTHIEVFSDENLCSSYQHALALVSASPLEAQRLFHKSRYAQSGMKGHSWEASHS